jgi:hypothetical protein
VKRCDTTRVPRIALARLNSRGRGEIGFVSETVPLPGEPGDEDQPPAETRAVPAAGGGGDLESPPDVEENAEDEAE